MRENRKKKQSAMLKDRYRIGTEKNKKREKTKKETKGEWVEKEEEIGDRQKRKRERER